MLGVDNYFVGQALANSNYGFKAEAFLQVTIENGVVKLNGEPINDFFRKLTHDYQGTLAFQLLCAPVMGSVTTNVPSK